MFYITLLVLLPVTMSSVNITMTPSGGQPQTVFINSQLQEQFNNSGSQLSCVEPQVFILSQTPDQYNNNSPYQINVVTDEDLTISLTTQYGRFQPSLSATTCNSSCQLTVTNNCPSDITSNNFFDILSIQITGLPNATYKVWCDTSFRPASFQWGLFLIILLVTVIISLAALYSRAWSFGGRGIRLNYWYVLALGILWVVGGAMGAFLSEATYIIVLVLSWIIGVLGVAICSNQILWLFKCECLNKPLFWVARPIDIISLFVGSGVVVSWWLTNMNWISSDIIAICTIVAFVKLFKFTSMKVATLMLGIILLIEVVIALVIYFVVHQSYNTILLNNFNNPMFLQLPTINIELNQRCAWLPVTQVIFPGIFISYLRRFDDSRNTRVYLIVSCIAFYIGSMAWMLMTIFNIHAWPFALFSETLLLAMVALFATQRNEIRLIWSGKFYDEQFPEFYEGSKFSTEQGPQIEMRNSLFEALRASSIERRATGLQRGTVGQDRPTGNADPYVL